MKLKEYLRLTTGLPLCKTHRLWMLKPSKDWVQNYVAMYWLTTTSTRSTNSNQRLMTSRYRESERNKMKIEVPSSWEAITLRKYQAMNALFKESKQRGEGLEGARTNNYTTSIRSVH
jgi:hypothetical protein